MDQHTQASTQTNPLDSRLLTYLHDTVRRDERRRRRWAVARWGLLLMFAFVACQWPHPRSDAADRVAIANAADAPTSRLAAFSCPQLEGLIAERTAGPTASLQRLAFAEPLSP